MNTDQRFTPGARIDVITCTDHNPTPAGATGTVHRWNARTAQLKVNWDDPNTHRRLMLVIEPGADETRVI
jgi:hypothetical protein